MEDTVPAPARTVIVLASVFERRHIFACGDFVDVDNVIQSRVRSINCASMAYSQGPILRTFAERAPVANAQGSAVFVVWGVVFL